MHQQASRSLEFIRILSIRSDAYFTRSLPTLLEVQLNSDASRAAFYGFRSLQFRCFILLQDCLKRSDCGLWSFNCIDFHIDFIVEGFIRWTWLRQFPVDSACRLLVLFRWKVSHSPPSHAESLILFRNLKDSIFDSTCRSWQFITILSRLINSIHNSQAFWSACIGDPSVANVTHKGFPPIIAHGITWLSLQWRLSIMEFIVSFLKVRSSCKFDSKFDN